MERTLYIFLQADGSRRLNRAHCTFPSHMLSLCGLSTAIYTLARIILALHPQLGCATSSKFQRHRCALVRIHNISRVHDSVNTAYFMNISKPHYGTSSLLNPTARKK